MSRKISDDRLGAVHARLSAAIRKRPVGEWLQYRGEAIIEGHDLIALLDELRQRRKRAGENGAFKHGKTTRVLLAMGVGDTAILPPTSIGAITSARKSARKALDNPDAVWACQTLDDGTVKVTRQPDGSDRHYGKPKNPAVAILAGMHLNQVVVIEGTLYAALKQQARKAMGEAGIGANWKTETLTTGRTRVRRVS